MSHEKRMLVFFTVSLGVLLAYYTAVAFLFPPKPPEEPAVVQNEKPPEKPALEKPAVKAEIKPAENVGEKPAEKTEDKPAEKPADNPAEKPAAAEPKPAPPAEAKDLPQRWTTLGSIDPEGNYHMLVTFNSRGAAVERIEMSSDRYRALDDRTLEDQGAEVPSGYLGHLALHTEKNGGCRVRVVGAGTPAASAVCKETGTSPGLKVNDVIRKFSGEPIDSLATFEALRKRTKAGEEVDLEVVREEQGTPRILRFTVVMGQRPLEVVKPETSQENGQVFDDPLSLLWSIRRLGDRSAPLPEPELGDLPSLRNGQWGVIELPLPGGAVREVPEEERITALASDSRPGVKFWYRLTAAQLKSFGLDGDLYFVKSYHLTPISEAQDEGQHEKSYSLDMELALFYTGKESKELVWQLDGPTGLPLEGWWYTNKSNTGNHWAHVGARDVAWKARNSSHVLIGCKEIVDRYDPENADKPFRDLGVNVDFDYVGVDAQYFSAMLLPTDAEYYTVGRADALPVSHGDKKKDATYRTRADVTFRLTSEPVLLAPPAAGKPGPTWQQQFTLFAGPKDRNLLDHYQLHDAVNYGWWWFISPYILGILNFFYSITGNYGIAIILLTVLVRGCMFPLSLRAVKNAAKMQELKPELDKIAEKYKKDLEARGRAQQDLFRKHNYNPMAGCLPMFLQLPVFMGLYRALQVSLELRQAPLIPGLEWCSNLAGPDKLFYWEPFLPAFLAAPTGYFGPFFNLLPMITITLFLINQKMMLPPATDEQTRMQQQMMTVMTVMMGVMFFKVPAGLCIYFITSSIWGMCERKLLPKKTLPTLDKDKKDIKPADKKDSKNGKKRT